MCRLSPLRFITFVLTGCAATAWVPLAAQEGRARVQAEGAAETREARPQGEALHVEAADPQLDAILKQWHNKTRDIKKLQGEHTRWTYETTFSVASVSTGMFYYESPDKGRIDIEPKSGNQIPDADPKTDGLQIRDDQGRVYSVKDDQPERWACDGKQIVKIDDSAKTYELLPIPPNQQGANIMDGPLPFLFGLPPEKAKQRYSMKYVAPQNPEQTIVYLIVMPRLPQDAANWQRADVMLSRDTFLPHAVKLTDPSGNRTTVFRFEKHEVNPINLFKIFVGEPYRPNLYGLKQVQAAAPAVAQPLDLQGKPISGIPSVIGLDHKTAKDVLGQRGFRKVEIRRGSVTNNPKQLYRVERQQPAPDAAADPNQTVVLTLFIDAKEAAKSADAASRK